MSQPPPPPPPPTRAAPVAPTASYQPSVSSVNQTASAEDLVQSLSIEGGNAGSSNSTGSSGSHSLHPKRPSSSAPTSRPVPPSAPGHASGTVDAQGTIAKQSMSVVGETARGTLLGADDEDTDENSAMVADRKNPNANEYSSINKNADRDTVGGGNTAVAVAVAVTPNLADASVSFLTELTSHRAEGVTAVQLLNAHNLPAEDGFSRTTRRRLEMPADVLKRVLYVGEEVTGEFDYYYPTSKVVKSMVTHVKMTLATFGLYLLYLAWNAFAYWVRNLCGVAPTASFRGKMVVTNRGRMIFWNMKAEQWRWFGLGGRAFFNTAEVSRILHIQDIRETTVRFRRAAAFLCCCMDTKVSLEVVFNSFPYGRHEYSKDFQTFPVSEYINDVHSATGAFETFFNHSFFGDSKSRNANSAMGMSQALVLRLVSKVGDHAFATGDHGFTAFEEILNLNQHLSSYLQSAGEAFSAQSSKQAYPSTSDMFDFKIVEDNNDVTIPAKYIPLAPGERIISTVGQQYKTTCGDITKSVFTLGLYWLYSLRHRQKERTALVLTNNRLIELWLQAYDGKIENSFSQHCRIRVRSIFPGKVLSGYISSDGGSKLESSILSTAGQVKLVLPLTQDAAFFAQAMHSVPTRQQVNIDASLVPAFARSEVERKAAGNATSENEVLGHVKTLPYEVTQILPLISGEKVLHYYDTDSHGLGKCDGGRIAVTNRSVIRITNLPRGCLTGKKVRATEDSSRKSVSHVKAEKFGVDASHNPYFVVWVPAHDVVSQRLDVKSTGAHPVSFCCSLLRWTLPTFSQERYCMTVQTKLGFTLPVFGHRKFSNYEYDCCSKYADGDAPYLLNSDLNELAMVLGLYQHAPSLPAHGDSAV